MAIHKKLSLVLLAVIFLMASGIILFRKENKITINNHKFKIETVVSEEAREKGLSGRTELCDNCGMLFLFNTLGNHSFWMKDMNFDIDILWIANNEVVQIDKNVSASRGSEEIKTSKFPVDKVLEINAGKSDTLGIKVGDKIK